MAVLDRFDIQRHIKVINGEIFQGVDRNKPVVFLYPHLGNWELLALYIVSLGFKLNILYERVPNRFQRRLLRSARRRSGYELISPDYHGTKMMYRALDRGESIGMAIDEFKHGRIIAPDFNSQLDPYSNIRYAVKMARRFGADIFTGYCRRDSNSILSFEIIVSDHINLTDPPFMGKSDSEIADIINARCQDWIIGHADQWYMLHRARI